MWTSAVVLSALSASALAAPVIDIEKRASTPTVYLASDSTCALGGGGAGTQGKSSWGEYLKYSLSIPVINKAIAGRSARSYTVEGHFNQIAALLKPNDFVVIEFGHNDGGSLNPDNGRTDCPGDGDQVCNTTVQKGILTFPAYMTAATKKFTSLGARVILSSHTPDNPWEGGRFAYGPDRFTGYDKQSAAGFPNASFVDHGQLVATEFQKLGAATVNSFFPHDHTHTSPKGADIVAQTFVRGVLCSTDQLKSYVKNATDSVVGSC